MSPHRARRICDSPTREIHRSSRRQWANQLRRQALDRHTRLYVPVRIDSKQTGYVAFTFSNIGMSPCPEQTNGKGDLPMKRLLSLAAVALICASTSLAQSEDYKSWEFFGGYSALSFDNLGGDTNNAAVDEVLGGKNTLRGFNLAITRNFHRYVGVKFDFSRQGSFSCRHHFKLWARRLSYLVKPRITFVLAPAL